MTEAFTGDVIFGTDVVNNTESEKILREAVNITESYPDQMFPSVPINTQRTLKF